MWLDCVRGGPLKNGGVGDRGGGLYPFYRDRVVVVRSGLGGNGPCLRYPAYKLHFRVRNFPRGPRRVGRARWFDRLSLSSFGMVRLGGRHGGTGTICSAFTFIFSFAFLLWLWVTWRTSFLVPWRGRGLYHRYRTRFHDHRGGPARGRYHPCDRARVSQFHRRHQRLRNLSF